LSAGITKGDKGGTIRASASPPSRPRSYIEIERAVAVEKFRTRSGINRIPGALMCVLDEGRIEVPTATGEHRPLRPRFNPLMCCITVVRTR
jgi:hypothetical protein